MLEDDGANSFLELYYNPFTQDINRMASNRDEELPEFSVTSPITIAGKREEDEAVEEPRQKFCGPGGPICRYFQKEKFGTWDGVYLSCLLAMFGVIMFLRLGYVVGEAGIWQTWLIELLSIIIVLITTLSMSAICSNGEIKQGGAYYIISRSLGPEIGGSIGILFTLGNSIAIGLHVLGFVEPMVYQINHLITNSLKNDMRVYGSVLLVALLIFAVIGVGWVIKAQFLIAAVIALSILCFVVGCVVTVDEAYLVKGLSGEVFKANLNSAYTSTGSFIVAFGVFFPAMTGIMAGANLSGDLVNPSENIPTGTSSAVVTAGVAYILLSTLIGATVLRADPSNCGGDATVGLCYNLIMVKVAVPGEMIFAGLYAASFSSALGALVGAPRIFTSVAEDNLLNFLSPFAVKRRNGEPLFAYIPVVLIAMACICIADLNVIAEIVSITYLTTYCLVNFACFWSSISKSPGWRPKFRFFNRWIALFGCVICFVLTFVLNYRVTIPVLLLTGIFYVLIYWNQPQVNWGPATHAVAGMTIIRQLVAQRKQPKHIKNFRPNIMLLTSDPQKDDEMIKFIQTLKHAYGANFIGIIHERNTRQPGDKDFFEADSFERGTKIVLFKTTLAHENFYAGCEVLLNIVGIGRIKPNTVFLKHPKNWREDAVTREGYFNFVVYACRSHKAVMIALNFERLAFENTDPFGTVDIWWLYDDGGLSVLIPHILSKSAYWRKNTSGGSKKVPLRLFIVSPNKKIDREATSHLLARFRLSKIQVRCVYPEEDIEGQNKWHAMGNLMRRLSGEAKLIFCTMPDPTLGLTPVNFFEMIQSVSDDMPSMIVMRGTGKSVLTWSQE